MKRHLNRWFLGLAFATSTLGAQAAEVQILKNYLPLPYHAACQLHDPAWSFLPLAPVPKAKPIAQKRAIFNCTSWSKSVTNLLNDGLSKFTEAVDFYVKWVETHSTETTSPSSLLASNALSGENDYDSFGSRAIEADSIESTDWIVQDDVSELPSQFDENSQAFSEVEIEQGFESSDENSVELPQLAYSGYEHRSQYHAKPLVARLIEEEYRPYDLSPSFGNWGGSFSLHSQTNTNVPSLDESVGFYPMDCFLDDIRMAIGDSWSDYLASAYQTIVDGTQTVDIGLTSERIASVATLLSKVNFSLVSHGTQWINDSSDQGLLVLNPDRSVSSLLTYEMAEGTQLVVPLGEQFEALSDSYAQKGRILTDLQTQITDSARLGLSQKLRTLGNWMSYLADRIDKISQSELASRAGQQR